MRRRTRARELALQYLYCVESSKAEPRLDAALFLADQSADEAVRRFALDVIHGCEANAEAIDLAKRFGSEKSGSFVNGVLDAIREQNDRQPFHLDSPGHGSRVAEPEGETEETTFDGGEFPAVRL